MLHFCAARTSHKTHGLLCLQFVFHHAPGARALRFVRKLPLLKGLSDNALLEVAARMSEETYEVTSCLHLLLPQRHCA